MTIALLSITFLVFRLLYNVKKVLFNRMNCNKETARHFNVGLFDFYWFSITTILLKSAAALITALYSSKLDNG
jgi:hypothetical protein